MILGEWIAEIMVYTCVPNTGRQDGNWPGSFLNVSKEAAYQR